MEHDALLDNLAWFHHAVARENYWSTQRECELTRGILAEWKRQKIMAFFKLTQAERKTLKA